MQVFLLEFWLNWLNPFYITIIPENMEAHVAHSCMEEVGQKFSPTLLVYKVLDLLIREALPLGV